MPALKGTGASPGIAIGKALVIREEIITVDRIEIAEEDVKDALKSFEEATSISLRQLELVREKTSAKLGKEKAAIFKAHQDILLDPALRDSVKSKIKDGRVCAAFAVQATFDEFCAMFEGVDNEYLKERAADVRDVGRRVVRNILGKKVIDLSALPPSSVIIAKDLMPSDTAMMDLDNVSGFITDAGGRTSHTSIMARSLEIPAVVGAVGVLDAARDGSLAVFDGREGEIVIDPSEDLLLEYIAKRDDYVREREKLEALRLLPAVTRDGKEVRLCANVGNEADAESALKHGAEGIGLYRTEFLYMQWNAFPSEDQQFAAYKAVCDKMAGHGIIIRTLDIGGDKDLPYFKFPPELNPFLGWRAVRMCLDKEDLFKAQLKAIIRTSAFGKVRIMLPMIISLEEFRKAKSLIAECKNELKEAKIDFDKSIKVGMMVETPAAVLMAEEFANEVDFFSIGTNDLTQYILAVDRTNKNIAHLYNPFHPAVLRAIKKVIDAAHKAGKWTSMCGELAGDESAVLLLLGLGLDEFSMSSISVPVVKKIIRNADYKCALKIAEAALKADTVEAVRKITHPEKPESPPICALPEAEAEPPTTK
ncbi:MAG: phosphoenolpyruvate--protein phosphotransferase [Deltaproteobacteria bacterium]|jgi:phosphotransferase system enzyme I (PtsI)|nr:phosphoenolpyruvate--protein phosphotransferase [Deltaproteobacteria bacterium]